MKKETGVIAFEITGDSMANGTHESFKKGCYVFTEPFNIEEFKENIANNLDSFWIIGRKDGYTLKQITQYTEEYGIRCHSLNPEYQDFIMKLEDITCIFLVTASQTKVIYHREKF